MSQRSKNIFLVVGFLLVLLIGYKYSFSKTFELKKELETLDRETLNSQNISALNTQLLLRERYADSILESNNLRNSSIQNNLLEFLNGSAKNNLLELVSFNPTHRVENEDGNDVAFQIVLKGTYSNIEEVLHSMEQDYAFGELIHLHFTRKRDFRQRKDYLECFVVLKNLESK